MLKCTFARSGARHCNSNQSNSYNLNIDNDHRLKFFDEIFLKDQDNLLLVAAADSFVSTSTHK